MGFTSWEVYNDPNLSIVNYKVQIDSRTRNSDGSYSFSTIDYWEQTEPFFKIEEILKKDRNLFIRISGLNSSGDIVTESEHLKVYDIGFRDNEPTNGGGYVTTTATWKCNGTDYAYEINKNDHNTNGGYSLTLSSTGLHDKVTGFTTPFYWYYDETARIVPPNFPGNGTYYGIPQKLHNNAGQNGPVYLTNSAHKYYNQTGGSIPGPTIGAIPKMKEEFEGNERSTNKNGSTWLPNNGVIHPGTPMNNVINRFNIYTNAINRDVLTCAPACTPSGGGWINSGQKWHDWLIKLKKWVVNNDPIIFKIKGLTDGQNITWQPNITNSENIDYSLFETIAIGDPSYNPNYDLLTHDHFLVSDYDKFIIRRYDEQADDIILDPTSIYLPNGTIQDPTLDLDENGLYQFFIFIDSLASPIILTAQANIENTNSLLTKADSIKIVGYPVPLFDDIINFSLKSVTNEVVYYELKNSTGIVLSTSQVNVSANIEEIVTINISENSNNFPELLFCTFSFTDGSNEIVKILRY